MMPYSRYGRGYIAESPWAQVGASIGELLAWRLTKGKREREADIGKVAAAIQRAESTGERGPLQHIATMFPGAVLEWENRTGRAFPYQAIPSEVPREELPLPKIKKGEEREEEEIPTPLSYTSPTTMETITPQALPSPGAALPTMAGAGLPTPMAMPPPAMMSRPQEAPVPYSMSPEAMQMRQFFEQRKQFPGLQEALGRWGAVGEVGKTVPKELLPSFTKEMQQHMPGVEYAPEPLEPFTTADMERINELWGPLSPQEYQDAVTKRKLPGRPPKTKVEAGKAPMPFADFVKFYTPNEKEVANWLRDYTVPNRPPMPAPNEATFNASLYKFAVEAAVLTDGNPNAIYMGMREGTWDSRKYKEEMLKKDRIVELRRVMIDMWRANETEKKIRAVLEEMATLIPDFKYEPSRNILQMIQDAIGLSQKYESATPKEPELKTGEDYEDFYRR